MHKKLALIVLLLTTLPVFGQHHIFRNVHVSLPSPECYRILQDNHGIVWIATEQGLCRFDAQTVNVYGKREGMPEREVYALRKDENGLVWLLTKKGRVLNIRNDRVIDAGFRQRIGNPAKSQFGYDFFFLKENILIPIVYKSAVRLGRRDKSVVAVGSGRQNHDHVIIEQSDGQVVPMATFTPGWPRQREIRIRYTNKDAPSESRSFILPIDNNNSPQIMTAKLKDRVFLGVCSRLVEIGPHGEVNIRDMPNRILSMSTDSRGGLWVGVLGNGVRYYGNGDLSDPPIQDLPGLSVTSIMEDRERHIWCTTLEKGVYICRQPSMLSFDNLYGLHRPPHVLTANHGQLLISGRRNEVVVLDALQRVERLTLKGNLGEYVSALKKNGDRWIVAYTDLLQSGTQKNGWIALKKLTKYPDLDGLQFSEWQGVTYVLGHRRIFSCVGNRIEAVTGHFSSFARSFLVLGSDKFLVAMPREVWYLTTENGETLTRILFRSSSTISRLFLTKNKRIFILTKGDGLLELCGGKVVSRNRSMHIPASVLNDMAEDNAGNLWIASNDGLLKLAPNGNRYGKPRLYDERHGFPSRVCDKLAVIEKTLAVSTTEGLITFPLTLDLQPAIPPGMSFDKAVVNGKPVRIQNAQLAHYQNSLLLYCSVQSYQSRGQALSYSLDDGSTVQRGVSGTVLSLKNLDPGSYRLTIFGQNIFGMRSPAPVVIDFTILPPFWLTWWFFAACLAVVAAGLLFAFRRIRKRLERRSNLKTQLVKSQLSALQAQMNPHFLFNSISSIQNFIMSNRRDEAYDYLTAFGKLIRRTLNNSRSQFISLAEEIETLTLYMDLERRRYNYRFDFDLELSSEIDPAEVLLPASLIQPLLENAIWHGVAGIATERHGKIRLEISMETTGWLLVTVTDNGVGVQPSAPGHKSLAIVLIEEQLSLLSGKSPDAQIRLGQAENGQGTTVSLTIPIQKKHEDATG